MKSILILLIALFLLVTLGFGQGKRKNPKTEKAVPRVVTSDKGQSKSVGEDEESVDPLKLIAAIKTADRLVVAENAINHGGKVLSSSTNPRDITEFVDALNIAVPDEWFWCPCLDSPVIRLYRRNIELAVITNHHATSISCSLWKGNAILSDPEKWLKWFDARGLTEPRKDFERTAARARQYEESEERWLAAMPKSIRLLWAPILDEQATPNLGPLRAAISREFPEIHSRILALLTWFGSGDGPWSGYPAYEQIAESLLLDFSTTDIVSTVQTSNLTVTQVEGTARLLGGWSFSHLRPDDLNQVPTELKAMLLEHSLKSTDQDKRDRAEHAFKKQ